MYNNRVILLVLLIVLASACRQDEIQVVDATQISSKSLFQAISFVNEDTIWISGQQAYLARTVDGGIHWQTYRHHIDSLQFRDIHAFDGNHVMLMSAGTGAMSRIMHFYADRTEFEQVYQMDHPNGFLNTIQFWDDQNGLAFGDAIGRNYFILKTADGGYTWSSIDQEFLPAAGTGEGGFAASGTCITTLPDGRAWIGTGAGGHANILYTNDFGQSWSRSESPLIKGEMAGIFSISMNEKGLGSIVGGDLAEPKKAFPKLALTSDFGQSWRTGSAPASQGVMYGSAMVNSKFLIVCGPEGLDYRSLSDTSWVRLDSANLWAVGFYEKTGLAVGPEGRVVRLKLN